MSLITSFFYLLSSYLKRINTFYLKKKRNYAVWYLTCNKTCRKHEVKKKRNGQSNQEAKAFLLQKNGISNNIFVSCFLFLLSPLHHLPLFCFFFQKASTSFSFTYPITRFSLKKTKIPNAKAKKALPLHKRPSRNNSPFSYSSCRSVREAVHLDSVLCYTPSRQRNLSFLAPDNSGLYLCLPCCSFCRILPRSFGSQHWVPQEWDPVLWKKKENYRTCSSWARTTPSITEAPKQCPGGFAVLWSRAPLLCLRHSAWKQNHFGETVLRRK